MKLRWYDRVLISLSGLALAAIGACAVLMGGGVVTPEWFALDTWFGSGWQWTPIIVLSGLILMAWGVWLMLLPFIRQRARGGKYYTVQGESDEDGVHISMQALDHLVHKALSVWPEILAANVKIGGQEDAMRITLRTTLQSNVRIPELIGDVRAEIKQYVEECAGVKVASVKVVVEATKESRAQKDAKALPSGDADSTPEAYTKRATEPRSEAGDVPVFLLRRNERQEAPVEQTPDEAVTVVSEADFGPSEPLPVTLSQDAFPFPEAEEPEAEPSGDSAANDEEAAGMEHTEEEAQDA